LLFHRRTSGLVNTSNEYHCYSQMTAVVIIGIIMYYYCTFVIMRNSTLS